MSLRAHWCRKNLASYKCPRYVVFAELPKTSTGKVQKFKLREMAKEVEGFSRGQRRFPGHGTTAAGNPCLP